MDKDYSFKLNNLVNNVNSDSSKIDSVRHKLNYKEYTAECCEFYSKYNSLMIDMAEENICTIADLNNYIDWIMYDK